MYSQEEHNNGFKDYNQLSSVLDNTAFRKVVLNMDIICETDPNLKALKKFYARIRRNVKELTPAEPKEGVSVSEQLSELKEEDKYGLIKPDQVKKVFAACDRNPNLNKPLNVNGLEGGNLARLLFSKAAFHNPSSTDYLIEDLKINDTARNSFLGGHSTYATSDENKLSYLRERQRKMFLTQEVKELVGKMDRVLAKQKCLTPEIERKINELILSGPEDSDVAILVGKRYIVNRKPELAIEELKKALDFGCNNNELAKANLSEALFNKGAHHFQRQEYEVANSCFAESLENNPDHTGSRLHLEMVQNKMMQQVPRRFGYPDTNLRYKRRL